MCKTCWRRDGEPHIYNERVAAVFDASLKVDGQGVLSEILDEWALDDDIIIDAMKDARCSAAERAFCERLLAASKDERSSALALAHGFFTPP